jgi:hypothetical protein
MSSRNDSIAPLAQAAKDIARSMLTAVDGRADESRVDTDAATFRRIGAMLERLCSEVSECGDPECMCRPIDGIRFWVATDRLKAEQDKVMALREENLHLKAALKSIADGDFEELRLAHLFGETAGVAHHVRDFAGRALGNA